MKFNKLFNVFLILIGFIFIFSIGNVNAEVSYPYGCKYRVNWSGKYDEKDKYSDHAVEILLQYDSARDIVITKCTMGKFLNGEFTSFIDSSIVTTTSPMCEVVEKSYFSDLFVYDDGIWYCPTKVSLGLAERSYTEGLLQKRYYDFFNNVKLSDDYNYSITEDNLIIDSKYTLKTRKYDPDIGKNSSGIDNMYLRCEPNGKNELLDLKNKSNEILNDYKACSSISKCTEIYNKIKEIDINKKKYCNMDSNILSEISSILKQITLMKNSKLKELNLNDKEKNEYENNTSDTDNIINDLLKYYSVESGIDIGSDEEKEYTCEGLLDENLKNTIVFILKIVRICIPIALIVLVTLDFSTAIISNDQDAIKKATSKAIKRAIAAVVIFFIPTIVNVLLNMEGVSSWTSTDPTCGIDFSKD